MHRLRLRPLSYSEHCSCPSDGKRNPHKAEDLWASSRAQRVKSLSLPPRSFCLWPLDQPSLPMRTHRNTTRLGLSGRKPARPEFCCSKDFFFFNFILLLRKEARACASTPRMSITHPSLHYFFYLSLLSTLLQFFPLVSFSTVPSHCFQLFIQVSPKKKIWQLVLQNKSQ